MKIRYLIILIAFLILCSSSVSGYIFLKEKTIENHIRDNPYVLNLTEFLGKEKWFDNFKINSFQFNNETRILVSDIKKESVTSYKIKNLRSGPFAVLDSEGNFHEYFLNSNINPSPEKEERKTYIIKFKDKPLVEKKIELQKEIENKLKQIKIETDKNILPKNYLDIQAKLEKELETELKKHDEKIQANHKLFKEEIRDINKLSGVRIKEFKDVFNGIALETSEESLEQIRKLPYVDKIYEDKIYKALLNDSLNQINASKVWNLLDTNGKNITGKDVVIAIIDTGVDYTHPDLGNCTQSQFLSQQCNKVIGGYNYISLSNDPMDDYGHGTHCAGIAAGNGTLKGVAPDAKILAYKVLNSYGYGEESDIISAIERAIDDGADIISLSLGGSGNPDSPLSVAVDNAFNYGVLVVTAAGNSGPGYGSIGSPANAVNAIAVGAINKTYSIADFSSRGPVVWQNKVLLKPEVVAPGVDICSAQFDSVYPYQKCIDDNHISMSGTSMAAPHVAGLVALLKQSHPSWTVQDLRSAIIESSIDLGYDLITQGTGLVDAFAANNVSILTNPNVINVSFESTETPVESIDIIIKNTRQYQISVNISVENATTQDGGSYNISYLNTSSVTINSASENSVKFVVNLTDQGGLFFGKIKFFTEGNNYTIPYIASRLTQLNVTLSVNGTDLYADLYVHDDEIKSRSIAYQWYDFIGSSYTFLVPADKNITVYAIGDMFNSSLTYILVKRIEVPSTGANITLSLSDSRSFFVNATSLSGSEIKIYEFEFGFATYSNNASPMKVRYYYSDYSYGNRIVYLSNKPESPFDIDIIVKYIGVPVSD